MATPNAAADMTDFFDFGEAAMPEGLQDGLPGSLEIQAFAE